MYAKKHSYSTPRSSKCDPPGLFSKLNTTQNQPSKYTKIKEEEKIQKNKHIWSTPNFMHYSNGLMAKG